MKKLIISLYDYTGNWSKPYLENGHTVVKVDIKHGLDIMKFNYRAYEYCNHVGLLIAQPCTCYALCGNRHKATRLLSGEFDEAQKLVSKTKEIVDFFNSLGVLDFWSLENPRTDIHKKILGLVM